MTQKIVLAPYLLTATRQASNPLAQCIADDEPIQTYILLQCLYVHINQTFSYQAREQLGVQPTVETLSLGTGSCRNVANLLMEAAGKSPDKPRELPCPAKSEPSSAMA